MKLLKDYKAFIGTLALVGVMLFIVLRLDSWYRVFLNVVDAFLPLVIGILIAYILNIIVVYFERIYFPRFHKPWVVKSRRPVSVVAALVTVLLTISFIMRLVVPQTIMSLTLAVQSAPQIYADFQVWTANSIHNIPLLEEYVFAGNFTMQDILNEVGIYITEGVKNAAFLVGNVVGKVLQISIGFIFAIYILLNKEILFRQIDRVGRAYISEVWRMRIAYVLQVSDDVFRSFFVGQFVDAVILGAMVGISMWAVGLSYASNIGFVIGLTALIPIVGAYIGGLIGIMMLATVGWWNAVLFLILLVIMQQIEGNFIYPKVVGNSIGLPGIWVFAAISVGAALYGIMGVLLSVPIAATLYKLLSHHVEVRLYNQKNNDTITATEVMEQYLEDSQNKM